jgi:thiamine kinase-like enzyme
MDDQEEIIEKLTQRVQAEQATAAELRRQNDLAEQSLNNLERTRQAESQRIRIWLGIAEQTAGLVQQLPEALLLLHGLDENLREVVRRLDRLENVVLLLLAGGNQRKANQLAESIEKDRQARLIETNKRMLEQLELKRAAYGNLEAPAHLLLQIEDLQNEIRQLEEG